VDLGTHCDIGSKRVCCPFAFVDCSHDDTILFSHQQLSRFLKSNNEEYRGLQRDFAYISCDALLPRIT